MDCLIKVWDLPSGKLIDCLKFDRAPTSICFSPTSEFLATTHVNELGVFLWSNKTLYAHVPLRQLPDDYEPKDQIAMPNTNTHMNASSNDKANENDEEDDDFNSYKNYTSPEQLDYELVTLSMLPESRWKSLVNLDIIKVYLKYLQVTKKSLFFFSALTTQVSIFKIFCIDIRCQAEFLPFAFHYSS